MMPASKTQISKTQIKDSGLAMVLIFLVAAYFTHQKIFLLTAVCLLLFSMTVPLVFKPFAFIWFGLAVFLGKISTKLILTLLFFFMVIPTGFIRRAVKSDPLQLKAWENRQESAFQKRDHQYSGIDMESPY